MCIAYKGAVLAPSRQCMPFAHGQFGANKGAAYTIDTFRSIYRVDYARIDKVHHRHGQFGANKEAVCANKGAFCP